MLAPRFTMRTLIAVLTVGALVFLVAGMAVRGQMWAWAITIGMISLGITALAHAAWFGVVWLFAKLPTARRPNGNNLGDGARNVSADAGAAANSSGT
jgi:hypothetical protein